MGLKDEVLAAEYVLGALAKEQEAALDRRMRRDRQFAATVRRWKDNLAEAEAMEKRELLAFSDVAADRPYGRELAFRRRPGRGFYGVCTRLWNSRRFWRLVALAASAFAAVLLLSSD